MSTTMSHQAFSILFLPLSPSRNKTIDSVNYNGKYGQLYCIDREEAVEDEIRKGILLSKDIRILQ